jgi:hypothetical protein
MKWLLAMALLVGAAFAQAQGSTPAKKELAAKVLKLQQGGIEAMARGLAERPAIQMRQAIGVALQTQVPPDKREATAKAMEVELRKYVDEAVPLLSERAVKLAPSVYGVALEEKFTEAELKQLVAWLESPVNKKFQQALPELQNNFTQKLITEASPLLDPKINALQQRLQAMFAATVPAPLGAPSASAPARPASK